MDNEKQISVVDFIVKLREKTAFSFVDCRNAAIESDYNFPKAVQILRDKAFEKFRRSQLYDTSIC